MRAYPLGALGAAVLGAMVVAAVFAPWLAPYDPLGTDYAMVVRPPSAAHPLGTDQFGRDVLSRIIFGARTALFVGLAASFVSATLGALAGVTTAYVGGKADLIAQRVIDILLSFPLVILAIAVVAVLGAGTLQVILAIIVPMLPRATRVVRASALAIRQMPYIEAAHSTGVGALRVIGRHVLPNVAASYMVMLTAFLAEVIVLEASLSFLGLGVVEPTPAWGVMLRTSRASTRRRPRGSRWRRGWRSASRCSPSTCWGMRCGTRSIRACADEGTGAQPAIGGRSMKRSTDRILTTHTGSLPRPADLVELLRRSDAGEPVDERAFDGAVRAAVGEAVRKQVAAGLTVVNDGEQGKPGYATYIKARVTGFGGQSRVTTAWAEGREFPEYVARRTGNTRSALPAPGL